jgi:serine/threonine protein kinase
VSAFSFASAALERAECCCLCVRNGDLVSLSGPLHQNHQIGSNREKEKEPTGMIPSLERMIIRSNTASYECAKKNGKGSFGVVYMATNINTGEVVAIKRVLQDRRYKVVLCNQHTNPFFFFRDLYTF